MQPDNHRSAPRKKKGSHAGRVLLVLLVILAIAGTLSFFAISGATDLFALGKEDRTADLTIDQGMSVEQIADRLGEKQLIEHPRLFRLYVRLRYPDAALQAGDYLLNQNMSYDVLISQLRAGNTVQEVVTLTFPEGQTARQIAKKLEEAGVCEADALIDCLQTESFDYEFIQMLPESDLRFLRLEGYLFPDTYDFFVGENVYSVAKKFLGNFHRKVFLALYEEIRNAGMTLDEVVTLASVIQEEASVPKEMLLVSSVFHNRLDYPEAGLPMLQSDVTRNYVETDIKPYQKRTVQEMYDAYNTYVCRGIPVGPICSPGVAAIEAAVRPEKSDYYFFVTDVNGKYYYSKMLDEHYYNVRKAAAVKKITD